MITLKNSILPLKGFTSLAVWPVVLVHSDSVELFDATARRHEGTHLVQQLEVTILAAMLLSVIILADRQVMLAGGHGSDLSWWIVLLSPLAYYALYLLDWLVRLIVHRDRREAYRNVIFEQEAYLHERDEGYLRRRRSLAWLGYVGRKTWRNPRKKR